ncbi:hypothetical protein ACVIGB_008854 [Bradyrhizobium sp. USDA 4341]
MNVPRFISAARVKAGSFRLKTSRRIQHPMIMTIRSTKWTIALVATAVELSGTSYFSGLVPPRDAGFVPLCWANVLGRFVRLLFRRQPASRDSLAKIVRHSGSGKRGRFASQSRIADEIEAPGHCGSAAREPGAALPAHAEKRSVETLRRLEG